MTLYTVRHVTCDEFDAYRVDVFKAFNAHYPKIQLPFIPAVFSKSESDCNLLIQLSNHYQKVWYAMQPVVAPSPYVNPYSLKIGDFSVRFQLKGETSITRLRNHFFTNIMSNQDAAYHLSQMCASAARIINESIQLKVA